MKTCTKCGIKKPLCDFGSNGQFGLHTACKKCASEHQKKRRLNNPELFAARDKQKHLKNREARLLKMREYNAANSKKRSEQAKSRYAANAEIIKEKRKAYTKANKPKIYALNAKRRAREIQATPTWANIDEISSFYELAIRLSNESGVKYHVDHIIPLNGKYVSGLHVQNNLQVIEANENIRKSNAFNV